MISYNNVTYDEVLERMLADIASKYPDVDTRPDSLAYNAIASSAFEIANLYNEQDTCLKESFVSTASREGLSEKLNEIGLSLKDATYSEFKAEFNIPIEIGTRFNNDQYNYSVIELLSEPTQEVPYYQYKLLCDTAGSAPNTVLGNLIPVDYVKDLEWANLTELLKAGEDEEDDDAARIRYFYAVNNAHTDGNVAQYKYWAEEYEGIGRAKITPCWNGTGTVKVSIVTPTGRAVSSSLLKEFQAYLDPESKGLGNGQAPIGAKVTVTTCTEKTINVVAKVKLSDGYSAVDSTDVSAALSEFFAEKAYVDSSVNYMKVGAIIMEVPAIETVEELKLNGSAGSVSLGAEEVAVLGTVNITVVT